ncbi:Damaged DNA binding [Balamuthia mandrillaris]
MTFTESKAGSKEARVRTFSFSVRDRLKQNVAEEEWEQMRIVCTHPFCNVSPTSTSLPIGLSFLRINSDPPPSDDKRNQASASSTSTSTPVSNAATSSLTSKNKTSQPSTSSLEREKEKQKETKHEEEEIPCIPYHKILSGVTFVISGMVNPERTNLRDQATSMGARYQPEWSNKATHLICPFPNTPKYKEVEKKGGTIVVPAWIEDCHAQKRRLPVDTYVLGDKPPTSMYEEEESTPYAGKSHEGTITKKSTANDSSSSDTEDMSEPQFGPSSVPKPPIQTTPAKEDSSSDTEEMPEVDAISLTSKTNAIKEPQEQEQDDRHKSDDEATNEMELVDENLLVDTQEIDAEPVNDDDRFLQDTQELEYSDEESEITDERKGKECKSFSTSPPPPQSLTGLVSFRCH